MKLALFQEGMSYKKRTADREARAGNPQPRALGKGRLNSAGRQE